MKNTVKLFGLIAIAALIGFTACDDGNGEGDDITWTAAVDGTANTTTSTKITFTFSAAVSGLTADNITLTGGAATKGALTGSGTSWELGITVQTAGTVSVSIIKDGVSTASQDVTVHKNTTSDITWTVAQVGGAAGENGGEATASTTAIAITFSEAVDLTEADIHIGGAASHDSTQEISSSGNVWTVPVTVTYTDNATVAINKDGIDNSQKTVLVYKAGEAPAITWTAEADGTEGTADSTKITFTFSEAVTGLAVGDITLTDENSSVTKGDLTGSGTTWELGITVTTPGVVSVAINKTGISATSHEVTVHKAGEIAHDITWTATANGVADTTTSTTITLTFSAAVHDLAGTDITLTPGTGTVTKGELTGSGTSWELGITVETAGTISVAINKAGISATAQDVSVHKAGSVEDITWTATADGVANTTTSTKITFTFSAAVSGLTVNDITLTNGAGSVTKSGLTYNSANSTWELTITVTTAGTVSVSVTKEGVVATAQDVTVHKAVITWTAVADGAVNVLTSTKITLTFSAAVAGLTANDITLTNGTGSVTKGALTGSGTTWDLAITVTSEGTVSVSVTKNGISATTQNVTVHKEAINPITDGLTTYIYDASAFSTTPITFSFSAGNSGTYEMESWGSTTEEGSWTWNQSALTITITASKVTDNWTYSGELINREEMESLCPDFFEQTAQGDIDYYMMDVEDGGMGMSEQEAIDFFLEYLNESTGTEYTTIEEYVNGETAKAIAAAFDPRPYTYTFSSDGASLILQESPTYVGTNELSGKTFSITGFEGSDTYTFSSGTYTENASGVTTTGSYSYNSTTKRVYLIPAVIDGQTPADFYDAVDDYGEFSPYPDEAAHRTGKTAEAFATRKYIYNLSDSSLSYDF